MKIELKSILLASISLMAVAMLFLQVTSTPSASNYQSCNWGNWYDTGSCVANSCGTSVGKKTQQKDCKKEVCDKGCPEVTWSTSKSVCPSGYPKESNFHPGYCYKDKRNPDWPKDYEEKETKTFGPITFKYKSKNSNKCERPSASSLNIPDWAESKFKSDNPSEKNKIDVNCRQEVVKTDTRNISCDNAPVIDCQPTTTPVTPTPTVEPSPTVTPTPTVDPSPTVTPTQTPDPTVTPTPTDKPSNGRGGSGWSAPSCSDSVPGTPTIISARYTSSVTVNWTKVSDANNYSIVYGPSSDNYPHSVFQTGDTDTYTINGIDSGCFRVKAINGCMPGELSPEVCTAGVGGGAQVLGASTLGSAGSFVDNIYNLMIGFGTLLVAVSVKKNILKV